jgi:hypothetical protein
MERIIDAFESELAADLPRGKTFGERRVDAILRLLVSAAPAPEGKEC